MDESKIDVLLSLVRLQRGQIELDDQIIKYFEQKTNDKRDHTQLSFQNIRNDLNQLCIDFTQFSLYTSNLKVNFISELALLRKQLMDGFQVVNCKYRDSYSALLSKYQNTLSERKKLLNDLHAIKGNIRVMCRARPLLSREIDKNTSMILDFIDGGIVSVNHDSSAISFEFDRVFYPKHTHSDLYAEVHDLVSSVLDGYNVSIIAYGATGTGKTVTMEALKRKSMSEILSHTIETKNTISVSVAEVYNESIRDLLVSDHTKQHLKVSHSDKNLVVSGLSWVQVSDIEQLDNIFLMSNTNRACGTNNINEHSSRSHLIFTLDVVCENSVTNVTNRGRLQLVDLAGSERVSKSNSEGARLFEAQNINRSLSALGDVIEARLKKRNHIPFRNSKLTEMLKGSLSKNAKTLILLHISPSSDSLSETLCTLRFGQRIGSVELGPAKAKYCISDKNI